MWMLIRLLAVTVLVVTGLLLAGQGGWLLDALDAVLRAFGSGPVDRSTAAAGPVATVAGLAVGAIAGLTRPLDRVAGQVVTLLHELGHTVVAAALGARPAGIVLRHDASGHASATWVGRATPGRRIALAIVAFAGVPAATVATAAGAQMAALAGHDTVLWSLAVAGVVVAVLARSAWSLLIAGALAGLAVLALGEAVAPFGAGVVVAVLTAIAVTASRNDLRAVRATIRPGDDARAVTGHLHVPARLVRLVRLVQTTIAVGLGAWTSWLLADPLLR